VADNEAATSTNDETATRHSQGHKGCTVTK